jgi:predicted LPLAT superfamily acyltransferase
MAGGWEGKSRGGGLGYRIFLGVIRVFGIRAAYALLFFVALYFIPASPKGTASVWRYARKILGYSRFRSAFFVFRNYYVFGQTLIDRFAIAGGLDGRYRFKFEGEDEMRALLDRKEGCITIGAHVGSWMTGAPFFSDYSSRLNIVMFDNEHESIKDIEKKNDRKVIGFKVIPVNKDNLEHVFMITEALGRGEAVCFQGDRYVNKDKLLDGTLLGHEAKFPSGPYILASMTGAPVMFYFAVREPHRTYRFIFRRAKPVGRKAAKELLGQFTEALDGVLSEHPEQWFNYYDFWNLKDKK